MMVDIDKSYHFEKLSRDITWPACILQTRYQKNGFLRFWSVKYTPVTWLLFKMVALTNIYHHTKFEVNTYYGSWDIAIFSKIRTDL